MQYLVIGRDGTDEGAEQRRMAVRSAHIALGDELVASGRMLYGVTLLDAAGQMTGSALVVDFPSRSELDRWLAREPYMTGAVWREIDIQPCAVGPSFVGLRRPHA
jgi:uncharacterized protein YciI